MTWTVDGVGPAQFGSRHYDLNRCRVLELCGEFDLATEPELRAGLELALASGPAALIVDLTRVGFCDVGCARMILAAARRTYTAVVGLSGAAALVFNLIDPTEDLTRHRSVKAAAGTLSELGPNSPGDSQPR